MRIVVTGVKGQLGYDCVRELKQRGYKDVIGIDKDELDITDEKAVREYFQKVRPDVIMHNAAWTAVDKAEECIDIVKKVNVDGVSYIARAAEEIGAKLLYISTDYVFPGSGERFYEVDDPTGPISVYGRSKLDGEIAARQCTKTEGKCSFCFIH